MNKSYLREETRKSQLFSSKGDIKKSSVLSTFEKKCEKKSRFPTDFWLTKSKGGSDKLGFKESTSLYRIFVVNI